MSAADDELETVPRCDVCDMPVIRPGKWRHDKCVPPPIPAEAREAIERLRGRAGAS